MYQGFVSYITDTETTGLTKEHEVIEFSSARLTFDSSFNPQIDQKTWYLKATLPDLIEEEALRINGHSRNDILHFTEEGKKKYLEPSDVIVDIENWIMEDQVSSLDRILIGQNINFDVQAMQTLWKRHADLSSFPFALEKGERILDTKQLVAFIDLCTGKRRQYFNLSSLVKAFEIKKGKAHQASEDVRMTTDLVVKIIQAAQPVLSQIFQKAYLNDE